MTKLSQLSDKDFKEAIIKIFWQATVNTLRTNEKLEKYQKTEFLKRNP